MYGVLERQFRNYYETAARQQGITGENLLRCSSAGSTTSCTGPGFASTRAQARQLVNHGHFQVNGKKVDIPSYQVRQGDVVTLKERSANLFVVQHVRRHHQPRRSPNGSGSRPMPVALSSMSCPAGPRSTPRSRNSSIVELYSK